MRRYSAILIGVFIFAYSICAYAENTQKLKVKNVFFQSNKIYSARKLKKLVLTRPSTFFSKKYYYSQILEDDIENLRNFYYSNGYLETNITKRIETDTNDYSVQVFIDIEEGELTHIENVSILGNKAFADDQIGKQIKIREGDAFKKDKIEADAKDILSFYTNKGYIEAEIRTDIQINPKIHLASVDYVIKENQQYSIDGINIKGIDKTKPKVIKRELLFDQGEIINYSNFLKSQRNLYLTGLFQNVLIKTEPINNDLKTKNIVIEVKENLAVELGAAIGYDSVEKFWQKIEIYNSNLAGTARKIGFTAQRSDILTKAEGSFTEPWTFGFRWQTDTNIFTEYGKEPGYDFVRRGGQIVFGKNLGKNINLSFSYRIEDVKLENIKMVFIDNKDKRNSRGLIVGIVKDTRNNVVNPTRGLFLESRNEIVDYYNFDFIRSAARMKLFYPLSGTLVFGTAMEIGLMGSSLNLEEIPLNERFYTGGPNSLRGFGYNLVGPLDANGFHVGGKLKVVWNIFELRKLLYKMFSMALFSDVGNIWKETNEFKFSDFRVSAGVGLRVTTVIGIVRCDYGVNLKPKEGEARSQVFINTGLAF